MMLIDAIVQAGLLVIGGVVGLFPAYTLPTTVTTLGSNLGSAVAGANSIFPVITLGLCLGVALGGILFLALWNVLVLVYDLIPFKAT
jgi:hypothetical protein